MSDMVHYKGTLKEVPKLENETLEEQCKRLLNNLPLRSYYDSYEEMLNEELYEKYVINKNIIYEFIKCDELEYDSDVYNINKNKDDTYNFEVLYYNGGCCLNEAINEAFDKLDEDE